MDSASDGELAAPPPQQQQEEADVWLFGYGSLIWKPALDFVEQRDVYVDGYVRRFWQGSPDHRGTEASPGRVVTLLTCAEAAQLAGDAQLDEVVEPRVWGAAFRVTAETMRRELAALEHREKAGYAKAAVEAVTATGDRITALVFRATPDNEHFLGPSAAEVMGRHIASSHGPSGPNAEYFLRLVDALEAMQARVEGHSDVLDGHLRAILPHVPAATPAAAPAATRAEGPPADAARTDTTRPRAPSDQ